MNDFSSASAFPMACSGNEHAAGDLVYQFTAPTTGTVRATVTPGPGFDPALLVLSPSCTPASCTEYEDVGSAGTDEQLDILVTAGATYYLVVDGWRRSEGAFTIRLTP